MQDTEPVHKDQEQPRRHTLRRVLRGWVWTLALLLCADQVLLHTALQKPFFLGQRILPYAPPLFTHAAFDALAEQAEEQGVYAFDPDLGWEPRPAKDGAQVDVDWAGCRPGAVPMEREPQSGVRRIAVIGDESTWGVGITGAEAWPAVLSATHRELEFANLAVPGYGLDQAWLRMVRHRPELRPREIWVVIVPERLVRLGTRLPNLCERERERVAFKPRFALDGTGAITFLPNPARSPDELRALLSDPAALFAELAREDPFIAAAPAYYSPATRTGFALPRLLASWKDSGPATAAQLLAAEDGWLRPLAAAAISDWAQVCWQSSSQIRVLILPGPADRRLLASRPTEPAPWSGLVEDLEEQKILCLDISRALLALEEAEQWNAEEGAGRGWQSAAAQRAIAAAIEGPWL